MNIIQKIIKQIDAWQQRHRLPAFLYGVVKKYGDDQAGYQAALLTYYGFLSLFPLLLVLTTIAGMVAGRNPELQDTIISSMTDYFPVLGNQLAEHITSLHQRGIALAIGILLTLYGARGVADAFQHSVADIWKVPLSKRPGFPKNILKSLGLILIGGFGLLLASVAAGFAAAAGQGWIFRGLSIGVNLFALFWLFSLVLNICLPKHIAFKDIRSDAATAAVGLVVLQICGGYLLAQQLKSLDALYSNFAIPLGLLFWIYLQAQVIYYAVEIVSVKASNAWPRSLSGKLRTDADKRLLPE